MSGGYGCRLFCWNGVYDALAPELEPYSLPAPLPEWPKGKGFATGIISLGEIEVVKINDFESVWSCRPWSKKAKGAAFYKPRGARAKAKGDNLSPVQTQLSALAEPVDYTLVWCTDEWGGERHHGCGYFWLPIPPEGYRAVGYVVSEKPDKPSLEDVRCVRADLTETCEKHGTILDLESKSVESPFHVSKMRPCDRGMLGKGVSVGTFFCTSYLNSTKEVDIACLKNLDSTLHAMPTLEQVHALIKHYGPTVFFHPNDKYLPSSVPWFFKNGAMLYKKGEANGLSIDSKGSILPCGGSNDGEYWIDLPSDDSRDTVICGDLESAELYVHVKPALGGTFTDIVMWVFCPFNGPATIKLGIMNIALNRIGQHVSDWEHFTLRVSNFTGELWSIYFSQHSGGEWVDVNDLEFIEGNKAVVYSSKSGHASFPHPGCYLQGTLGIGVRNDAARSKSYVDSSANYKIIAAEYLSDENFTEPPWLQFMREWGPTIKYDSRSEIEKIVSHLPFFIRFSVESIFEKLPNELYGEEGPTGPKEKNNWIGDERS
ncbi:hypothetical protein Sjap_006201 [Stephania japonica]|uniref:Vacuolar protein sorting-associated protein 62 n=1 Tax=Stephania japonica TaxID=461633 RepID=A0AAP0K6Y2_9MAGN